MIRDKINNISHTLFPDEIEQIIQLFRIFIINQVPKIPKKKDRDMEYYTDGVMDYQKSLLDGLDKENGK